MSKDVLVAMDCSKDAEDALRYTFEEYSEATVYVVHVTATNDTFGLFDSRDPGEYMVAECGFEFDDELMPDGNAFNRHQRQRAQAVIKRACRLADEYSREIEPIVRSGNTVENVVSCAEVRSVDHIVIGDHRQTEIRPIMRGIPESIIRKASRPVTVVS